MSGALLTTATSTSSTDLCRYCKVEWHSSNECFLAIRAGLLKSKDKHSKGLTLLSASAMTGLVEPREADTDRTLQLLTKELFRMSSSTSGDFARLTSGRRRVLERVCAAVARREAALRPGGMAEASGGGTTEKDTSAAFCLIAFQSLAHLASSSTGLASPEGRALRHDVASRVAMLLKEMPSLSLFEADTTALLPSSDGRADSVADWQEVMEDWLAAIAADASGSPSEGAGSLDLGRVSRTALLDLAACRGSLRTILRCANVLLGSEIADVEDRAVARLTAYRKCEELTSCLLHDATEASRLYLGAWMIDSLQGESGSDSEDDDDGEDRSEKEKKARMLMRRALRDARATGDRAAARQLRDMVKLSKDKGDVDELGVVADHAALASDGQFLYVHSSAGLRKLGTGYGSSVRGRCYGWVPKYRPDQRSWLAYVGDRLYFRSSDVACTAIVLDPETLSEVGQLNVSEVGPTTDVAPSPMLTCGKFLYFVSQHEEPSGQVLYFVHVYDPSAGAYIRRIQLFGPSPTPIHKAFCGICHRAGFSGVAYKCAMCQNYHECADCHKEPTQAPAPKARRPGRNYHGMPQTGTATTHSADHAMNAITAETFSERSFPITSRLPSVTGKLPKPRRLHAAAAVGSSMYVFGGASGSLGQSIGMFGQGAASSVTDAGALDDLIVFDSAVLSWRQISAGSGEAASSPDGTHEDEQEEKEAMRSTAEEEEEKEGGDSSPSAGEDAAGEPGEKTSSVPTARSGHTLNPIGNDPRSASLILFGGAKGKFEDMLSDVHRFDTATATWTPLPTTVRPPARMLHASSIVPSRALPAVRAACGLEDDAVYDGSSESKEGTGAVEAGLLVFGGLADKERAPGSSAPAAPSGGLANAEPSKDNVKVLSDLWFLELPVAPTEADIAPTPGKWVEIETEGDAPSRYAGDMFLSETRSGKLNLVVLGGGEEVGKYNKDVYVLDLSVKPALWSKMSLSGDAPNGKCRAAPLRAEGTYGTEHASWDYIVPHDTGSVLVLGGQENNVVSRAVLDLSAKRWRRVERVSGADKDRDTWWEPTRDFASAVVVGDTVVEFGGAQQNVIVASTIILEVNATHSSPLTPGCLSEGSFYTNGHELAVVLPPNLPPNVALEGAFCTRVFKILNDGTDQAGSYVRDSFSGSYVELVDAPRGADPTAPTLSGAITFDGVNNVIYHFGANSRLIKRWCNVGASPLAAVGVGDGVEAMLGDRGAAGGSVSSVSTVSDILATVDRLAVPVLGSNASGAVSVASSPSLREPFFCDVSLQTFEQLAALLDMLGRKFTTPVEGDGRTLEYSIMACLRLLEVNFQRAVSYGLSPEEVGVAGERGQSCLSHIRSMLQTYVDLCVAHSSSDVPRRIGTAAISAMTAGLPWLLRDLPSRRAWLRDSLSAVVSLSAEATSAAAYAAAPVLEAMVSRIVRLPHIASLLAAPTKEDIPVLAERLPLRVSSSAALPPAASLSSGSSSQVAVPELSGVDNLVSDDARLAVITGNGTADVVLELDSAAEGVTSFLVSRVCVSSPKLVEHGSPVQTGVICVWSDDVDSPDFAATHRLDRASLELFQDLDALRRGASKKPNTRASSGGDPEIDVLEELLAGEEGDTKDVKRLRGLVCVSYFTVKPGETVDIAVRSEVPAARVQVKFLSGATKGAIAVRQVAIHGVAGALKRQFVLTEADTGTSPAAATVPVTEQSLLKVCVDSCLQLCRSWYTSGELRCVGRDTTVGGTDDSSGSSGGDSAVSTTVETPYAILLLTRLLSVLQRALLGRAIVSPMSSGVTGLFTAADVLQSYTADVFRSCADLLSTFVESPLATKDPACLALAASPIGSLLPTLIAGLGEIAPQSERLATAMLPALREILAVVDQFVSMHPALLSSAEEINRQAGPIIAAGHTAKASTRRLAANLFQPNTQQTKSQKQKKKKKRPLKKPHWLVDIQMQLAGLGGSFCAAKIRGGELLDDDTPAVEPSILDTVLFVGGLHVPTPSLNCIATAAKNAMAPLELQVPPDEEQQFFLDFITDVGAPGALARVMLRHKPKLRGVAARHFKDPSDPASVAVLDRCDRSVMAAMLKHTGLRFEAATYASVLAASSAETDDAIAGGGGAAAAPASGPSKLPENLALIPRTLFSMRRKLLTEAKELTSEREKEALPSADTADATSESRRESLEAEKAARERINREVFAELGGDITLRALFLVFVVSAAPAARSPSLVRRSSDFDDAPDGHARLGRSVSSASAADDSVNLPPPSGPPPMARALSYGEGTTARSSATHDHVAWESRVSQVMGAWQSIAALEGPKAIRLADVSTGVAGPSSPSRSAGVSVAANVADLGSVASFVSGRGLPTRPSQSKPAEQGDASTESKTQSRHNLVDQTFVEDEGERYCETCGMYYPSFETGDSVCTTCWLCCNCCLQQPDCAGDSSDSTSAGSVVTIRLSSTSRTSTGDGVLDLELSGRLAASLQSISRLRSAMSDRRVRAQSRADGFDELRVLLESVASLPPKREALRVLAPALRQSFEARLAALSDPRHSDESAITSGRHSGHHYTDRVLGCGAAAMASLRRSFARLFAHLATLLRPSASTDASTRLALLSAWGMHFHRWDHELLHSVGLFGILRRFMESYSTDKDEQKLRDAAVTAFRTTAVSIFQSENDTEAAGSQLGGSGDQSLTALQKMVVDIIFAELQRGLDVLSSAQAVTSKPAHSTHAKGGGAEEEKGAADVPDDVDVDEESELADEANSEDSDDAAEEEGDVAEDDDDGEAASPVDDDVATESGLSDNTPGSMELRQFQRGENACGVMLRLLHTVSGHGSSALLAYLASGQFMQRLFLVVDNGSPRMQRLALRLLRRLLPAVPPSSKAGEGEALVFALLERAGRALTATPAGDAGAKAAGSRRGYVEQSYAAEIVGLVRSMWKDAAWEATVSATLQRGVVASVPELVAVLNKRRSGTTSLHTSGDVFDAASTVLPTDQDALLRLVAALAVLGGQRDFLRVGGRVKVTQKGDLGKQEIVGAVVSYARARGTMLFADSGVTEKNDGAENAKTVDTTGPVGPTQIHRLAAKARVEVLDDVDVNIRGLDISDELLAALRDLFRAYAGEATKSATSCLILSQIMSMTLRALSLLLRHPPTVQKFLSFGLGPDIVQFAEEAAAVSEADASRDLSEAEQQVSRLGEECQNLGLLNVSYDIVALAKQQETLGLAELTRIPHSPLTTFNLDGSVRVPTALTSKQTCIVLESPTAFSVTSELTGHRDFVCVRASHVIPERATSYYFEVHVVSGGMTMGHGCGIAVGLWPDNLRDDVRGRHAFPGYAPKSYGWLNEGQMLPADPKHAFKRPEKAQFGDNDTVGVGWDKRKGILVFTLNGKKLKDVRKKVRSGRYFPAVGVGGRGTRIEVNFGQSPFKFDWNASFGESLGDFEPAAHADGAGGTSDAASDDERRVRRRARSGRTRAATARFEGPTSSGEPRTAADAARERNQAGGRAAEELRRVGARSEQEQLARAAGAAGGPADGPYDIAAGGAGGGVGASRRPTSGAHALARLKARFLGEDSDESMTDSSEEDEAPGGASDDSDDSEEEHEVDFFSDDEAEGDAAIQAEMQQMRGNQLRNDYYQVRGAWMARRGHGRGRGRPRRIHRTHGAGGAGASSSIPVVLDQLSFGMPLLVARKPTKAQLSAIKRVGSVARPAVPISSEAATGFGGFSVGAAPGFGGMADGFGGFGGAAARGSPRGSLPFPSAAEPAAPAGSPTAPFATPSFSYGGPPQGFSGPGGASSGDAGFGVGASAAAPRGPGARAAVSQVRAPGGLKSASRSRDGFGAAGGGSGEQKDIEPDGEAGRDEVAVAPAAQWGDFGSPLEQQWTADIARCVNCVGVLDAVDSVNQWVHLQFDFAETGRSLGAWLPLTVLKKPAEPHVKDPLLSVIGGMELSLADQHQVKNAMLIAAVNGERRLRALYARQCLLAMLASWPSGLVCTPAPLGGAERMLNVVRPVVIEEVTAAAAAKGGGDRAGATRRTTLKTLAEYIKRCLEGIIRQDTASLESASVLSTALSTTEAPSAPSAGAPAADLEAARRSSSDLLELLVNEVVAQLKEAAGEDGYLRTSRGGFTSPARDVAIWVLDVLLSISPLAAIRVYRVEVYLAIMTFMTGRESSSGRSGRAVGDTPDGSSSDESGGDRRGPSKPQTGAVTVKKKGKKRYTRMLPSAILPLLPLLSRLLSRIGYFPDDFRPNMKKLNWLRKEMEQRYEKETTGESGAVAVSAYLCAVVDLMVTVRRTFEYRGMTWKKGLLTKSKHSKKSKDGAVAEDIHDRSSKGKMPPSLASLMGDEEEKDDGKQPGKGDKPRSRKPRDQAAEALSRKTASAGKREEDDGARSRNERGGRGAAAGGAGGAGGAMGGAGGHDEEKDPSFDAAAAVAAPDSDSDKDEEDDDDAGVDDSTAGLGPDLASMSWFDQVYAVAQLMKGMQGGRGLPPWFMRRAWLATELESSGVERESEHPYDTGTEFRRIEVPNADSLVVKVDSATAIATCDALSFYSDSITPVLEQIPSSEVEERLAQLALQRGEDDKKKKTAKAAARGAAAAAGGSTVEEEDAPDPEFRIKETAIEEATRLISDGSTAVLHSYSGVLVKPTGPSRRGGGGFGMQFHHYSAPFGGFDMQRSQKAAAPTKVKPLKIKGGAAYYRLAVGLRPPNHPNVFCSSCRRPVSGTRYTCAHCPQFNLCDACEPAASAGGSANPLHSAETHSLLVFRRGHPFQVFSQQDAVATALPQLFRSSDSRPKKSKGKPTVARSSSHTGVTCGLCKTSPITGTRYRCGHCADFDMCAACFGTRASEHHLGHVFVKIPRPLVVAARLPRGAFLGSVISTVPTGDDTWGYKFSVVPKFSREFQVSVLKDKQSDLEYAVNTQQSWTLGADHQLTELVSRICDKRAGMMNVTSQAGGNAHGGRSARTESVISLSPLRLKPKDVVTSEADIARYPLLERRVVEDMRLRFAVLRLLNARVASLLPLIDWTQQGDDESLAHTFRRLRGVVFSQLKMGIWDRAIKVSAPDGAGRRHGSFQVKLDRRKANGAAEADGDGASSSGGTAARASEDTSGPAPTQLNRDSLFVQLAMKLVEQPAAALRNNVQPFNVSFLNESGIDAGGLFRDCLSEVCAELQSKRLCLFIPCPNATNKVGYTLDKYIPNSACVSSEHLTLYEMVGRMMGMSVRLQEPLMLDFPTIVWKPLVGIEPELGDLEAVDKVLVKAMMLLKDDEELAKIDVTPDNFEEEIGYSWSATLASRRTLPLKTNGQHRMVQWDEKVEYADAVLAARLAEFSEQIAAIKKGLVSVVPKRLLSLLTPSEFESLVCGSIEVDIELLKKHTRYQGCKVSDPHIKFFWEVLEGFTQEERSLYLRFAWGRSRLPIASNFSDTMTITEFNTRGGRDDNFLPASHTCFFSVELPKYTTVEITRAKLLAAITMCTSVENA